MSVLKRFSITLLLSVSGFQTLTLPKNAAKIFYNLVLMFIVYFVTFDQHSHHKQLRVKCEKITDVRDLRLQINL